MSKYDKYKIDSQQNIPINKWDKYRIMPQQKQQGDSWTALIGKSALQGITSIADMPANVLGAIERGGRSALGFLREQAGKPNNIDQGAENDFFSPENTDRPSKWINASANALGYDLTPKPTNMGQRIASNAAEFAGSMGPLGLVGKGAGLLNASKLARAGAAIGGTSGVLQEGGVNPLVADLTSSIVAPSMAPKNLYSSFKKIPEVAAKVPLKLMGLSPKSLNIEAASAARDLGIDLPAAALTESKLTALADQFVGKTPYFGNKLGRKYINAEKQIREALDTIYNNVGPIRTAEIESRIANLYNESASTLPIGATIKPTNLKKAIDNIKIDTAVLSQGEKDLVDTLQTIKNEIEPTSKLVSQYGSLKVPLQDFDVNKLIGTKKSLNSIIKWDMDQGVKNQLRNVQKAVTKDIEAYGKTNPEWYKTFKEADSLFGQVAKREKLENALSNKSTNAATDSLSYNALSKAINSPEKNALIKKQVTPEVFEKIQKLGTVARAMAVKNRNVPNPSGTSATSHILAYLSGIYAPQAITGLAGTASLTKLLTDKKLLDLALKYAEKPTSVSSMAFNKRLKDISGYSAIALTKELQRRGDE